MKQFVPDKLEEGRIAGPANEWAGFFVVARGNAHLRVQISNGGGWDHVSVSLHTRCPTWDEMCWVKDLCWNDDEVVMQLHPAKSDYRSHHNFCLHLWRPQTDEEIRQIADQWGDEWVYGDLPSPGEIPMPDGNMVAPESSIK